MVEALHLPLCTYKRGGSEDTDPCIMFIWTYTVEVKWQAPTLLASDKQAGVMGHYMPPHICELSSTYICDNLVIMLRMKTSQSSMVACTASNESYAVYVVDNNWDC